MISKALSQLSFIYFTFPGKLQHGGDVSKLKIKCGTIRTREITSIRLLDELYVNSQKVINHKGIKLSPDVLLSKECFSPYRNLEENFRVFGIFPCFCQWKHRCLNKSHKFMFNRLKRAYFAGFYDIFSNFF